MLVLTRQRDEEIKIGSDIVIRVIRTGRGKVRIGVDAPQSVSVRRGEVATYDHAQFDVTTGADATDEFEECTIDSLLVQN